MRYYLGIDIGTFSSKGILIDEYGKAVAHASVPHGMENPKPGYYEQDAEAVWWNDFCSLSNQLIQKSGIPAEQIAAVGASTLGADCLPVDEHCRPLRKAILYGIDSRCTEEIEELTAYYGEKNTTRLFGRAICTGDVAPKILWIKKHEPDIYKNTHKFLTGSSYITAKLTGNYVVDAFLGVASFRPMYREDGQIRREMCEPVCSPEQLSEGRCVTSIAGVVTEEAARETGLNAGTPVITGTGDSAAEAISVGVVAPGELMVQFGSSVFFYCCTDHMVVDDRVRGNTFLIPDTFSIAAGTNNGGTVQKWYLDQVFPECKKQEEEEGKNAYASMMEGLEQISPGSDGLITLPYFAGERTPINDPNARGMIFGLTTMHTKQHLYHSLLEGIGYSVAQHMDIFQEHGLELKRIKAAGGGTNNALWMQMIADITGFPVEVTEEKSGACYGDALMAAIGDARYQCFSELKTVIRASAVYYPNEEKYKAYQKFRNMYDILYEKNKELMHQLSVAATAHPAAGQN